MCFYCNLLTGLYLSKLIYFSNTFFYQQELYHVTVPATPSPARAPAIKNVPMYRVWPVSAHAPRDFPFTIAEANFRPASKSLFVQLKKIKNFVHLLVRVLLYEKIWWWWWTTFANEPTDMATPPRQISGYINFDIGERLSVRKPINPKICSFSHIFILHLFV